MPTILSFSKNNDGLWAAGPEGLFQVTETGLESVLQPQQHLLCCNAIHDRILVGGAPHGVAYSLDSGGHWQAGWMDNVAQPVLCLAPAPDVEESGVMLAGTDGGGLLRSSSRGYRWQTSNFGLRSYAILALVWAPPMPEDAWPHWEIVFACSEEGIYRSPNGGRGWKRSAGAEGVFQTIAVAPDFHTSGVVLAGTETSGLWRSTDSGRSFQPVADTPERVNALAAVPGGWLLSDDRQLWHSTDGLTWAVLPDSPAALTLFVADGSIWAGNEEGVQTVSLEPA